MIIPILMQTTNIVDAKIDAFTDAMIEDIQDIIKVETDDDNLDFTQGILPPRYKELKEEMKGIVLHYILTNMTSKQAVHME
jgi:hypothetical protein